MAKPTRSGPIKPDIDAARQIAGAFVPLAERADQVVDGNLEEQRGRFDYGRGQEQRSQARKRGREHQAGGHTERTDHHGPSHPTPVGDASGIDRQRERKHGVGRNQGPDRQGTRSEFDRIERHQHSAALYRNMVQYGEQRRQIEQHE